MDTKHITNSIQFKGQGGEFFGIWIVNILLSVITLGIYSAWAKVRTKRYFYGNTFIAGDNFEYHAQPMQLLKGRLVALALVLIWVVANSFFPLASLVLFALFYVALPWLLWSNARFDSAMTSYRNVHFAFNGSLKEAYMSILGRGLASLLIIAIYIAIVVASANASAMVATLLGFGTLVLMFVLYAWVVAGIHQYFASGYQYGDWKFVAKIETGFFLKTYCKAMLIGFLTAVAFMIVMGTFVLGSDIMNIFAGEVDLLEGKGDFVYVVLTYLVTITMSLGITAYTTTRIRNYVFSRLTATAETQSETEFRFTSTFGAWDYMSLIVTNFLLQVITLGLARPWGMVRTSRYVASHTGVIGDMDTLKATDQDSAVKNAISDEVAQAFDLGLSIS
ncbi:Inner membrane protein YjgN [Vibrio vulnificus]|uniref:YjgN family protein n=1 Tax=Vibrio vulnificus TaxID=672 RepID=UPI0009280332|nr:YjgN family protein [Vibrio vulnificus]OJI27427.1 Inner membrane protein YjgN [Vibrio vulnificus]